MGYYSVWGFCELMHMKYYDSLPTRAQKRQGASVKTAARCCRKCLQTSQNCYERPISWNSYLLATLSSTSEKNNTGTNNSGMVNYCHFLKIQTKGNTVLSWVFLSGHLLLYWAYRFLGLAGVRLLDCMGCYGRCLWSQRGCDLCELLIPQQEPKLVSLFWRA